MSSAGPSSRAIVRIVLTITATVALIYLLYLVRSTLLLVFISVFLAVALGPAVAYFRRRGLPRGEPWLGRAGGPVRYPGVPPRPQLRR